MTHTRYLGFQISHQKVLADGSTERLKKARGRLHLLRNAGVRANKTDAHKMLKIFDSLVMATGMYGIQVTDKDRALLEA